MLKMWEPKSPSQIIFSPVAQQLLTSITCLTSLPIDVFRSKFQEWLIKIQSRLSPIFNQIGKSWKIGHAWTKLGLQRPIFQLCPIWLKIGESLNWIFINHPWKFERKISIRRHVIGKQNIRINRSCFFNFKYRFEYLGACLRAL